MKYSFKKSILIFAALAVWVILAAAAVFLVSGALPPSAVVEQSAQRSLYRLGNEYLIIEALADDRLHFAAGAGEPPAVDEPIYITPMIVPASGLGPTHYADNGQGQIETAGLTAQVDLSTLCVTVTDITRRPALLLTTFCPHSLDRPVKALTLTPASMQAVYGLGEQFLVPSADQTLDWTGKVRRSVNEFGNAMLGFSGGATGNAQFPILYVLGQGHDNYAVFVDSLYRQSWDFTAHPWKLQMQGDALRWYLLAGPDLPDLRRDYIDLTGAPLVPPQKAFGLWVSEYGYDNWEELEDKLASLRANSFPLDGFVLDLQWFGGVENPQGSQMGSLTWDIDAFPDPAGKIRELRDQHGVGLILIEESYINRRLQAFADLEARGYLVRACPDCPPSPLIGWWGQGSLLDWTNPAAGEYWHATRRQPLIEMGIVGHWTDLGEPEMYNRSSYYYGFPELGLHSQADVHNIYNFRWAESIYRGYQRSQVNPRPLILSRSGTSGIQRFGAGMWSADIGTNWVSLQAHWNAQAHMSLSGMDYFGSDIGGFHRGLIGDDLDEIYTQWFAASALLDVPVRPHTENLCNCKETAPDRVGDLESNRANIRLRYALSPYLYSLAHQAYQAGDPLFPPLFFYHQHDPETRQLGDHKLIGRDLLVLTFYGRGVQAAPVYLPHGEWYDFYNHAPVASQGQWLEEVPLLREGLFRPPLFARAGAILPMMHVDEHTLNILGQSAGSQPPAGLILRVYAGPDNTFTLYEDDGQSDAYRQGQFRRTQISLSSPVEWYEPVTIYSLRVAAATGRYTGAVSRRATLIQFVSPGSVTRVDLNGAHLEQRLTLEEFEAAPNGWYDPGDGLILTRTGSDSVYQENVFSFFVEHIDP